MQLNVFLVPRWLDAALKLRLPSIWGKDRLVPYVSEASWPVWFAVKSSRWWITSITVTSGFWHPQPAPRPRVPDDDYRPGKSGLAAGYIWWNITVKLGFDGRSEESKNAEHERKLPPGLCWLCHCRALWRGCRGHRCARRPVAMVAQLSIGPGDVENWQRTWIRFNESIEK